MRRLMWFTVGFAAVSLLRAYLPALWAMAACLALGAAVLLVRSPNSFRRCLAVAAGVVLGWCWFSGNQNFVWKPLQELDGQTLDITLQATDYSRESLYGVTVEGILRREGRDYSVRAYLEEGTTVEPGQRLSGQFRLRSTGPGEGSGGGGSLRAYQQDALTCQPGEHWRSIPARLRRMIESCLQQIFPPDTAPFAKALLLGDTQDLDYATDTDLKISGIRHVAAVSGLHISILFALISSLTFRKRFLTALLGFPALILFAAVAGFTPSVVRSCIMSGLMLLSTLLEKEYDGPTALAAAVLAMVLVNPLVVTAVGFQLSVASVAGIFLFSPGIRQWILKKLPGKKGKAIGLLRSWLAGVVSVSLGAQIFTTALSAWHFGTVSLIGLVSNLLLLWLISAVFCGIGLVCLLTLVHTGFASGVAAVVSVAIRIILWVSHGLASFPLAAVYTRSVYIVLWLALAYGLLAIFLLSRRRQPLVLVCCGCIGLCAALCASWLEPVLDGRNLTMLDVGQGQCLLLQDGGHTFLVDCGGDGDVQTADLAAQTLLSQGISRLDGVVVTHYDRDHAGGIANLLTRVDTDLLILPPQSGPEIPTEGKTVYASQDLHLTFDGGELRVYSSQYPGSSNENSLCVLFDTENCDILITGDRGSFGERMLLRNAELPNVDVLVAGHHGAADAACQELLDAVQPEIVCISVGADNPYGHPAPALLERLAKQGCAVYRTDQNGQIIIRRLPNGKETARRNGPAPAEAGT